MNITLANGTGSGPCVSNATMGITQLYEDIKLIYLSQQNVQFVNNFTQNKLSEMNVPNPNEQELISTMNEVLEKQLPIIFQKELKNVSIDDLKTKYENIVINLNKKALTQLFEEFSLKKKRDQYKKNKLSTIREEEQPVQEETTTTNTTISPIVSSQNQNTTSNLKESESQTEDLKTSTSTSTNTSTSTRTNSIENTTNEHKRLLLFSDKRDKILFPHSNEYQIENLNIKNVKNISLKRLIITNRIYNINNTNNSLILIENNQKTTINLPVGRYTENILLDKISSLLTRCSTKDDLVYHCKLDPILRKCILSVSGNGSLQNHYFGIDFCSDLNKILGFNKKIYLNNNKYLAESFIDLHNQDTLFLKLNKQYNLVKTNDSEQFEFFEMINVSPYNFNDKIDISFNNIGYTKNKSFDVNDLNIEWVNENNKKIELNSEYILFFDFE